MLKLLIEVALFCCIAANVTHFLPFYQAGDLVFFFIKILLLHTQEETGKIILKKCEI